MARRFADNHLSGFELHDYRPLGTVFLALERERMLRARTVTEEKSD